MGPCFAMGLKFCLGFFVVVFLFLFFMRVPLVYVVILTTPSARMNLAELWRDRSRRLRGPPRPPSAV